MAFLLIRSGKQMVRSSSRATPHSLLQVLTSRVNNNNNNNCFSTVAAAAASSPGGMNQQSNPKKDDAADMTATQYFGLKLRKAIYENKPLPSTDDPDYRKFVAGKPKDDVADPAFRDLLLNCCAYFVKNTVNAIQNKPVSSTDDFHKFLDDQFDKLPPLDIETASGTDQNPKAATPAMIKAAAVFADTITGGLRQYKPKPAFMFKGDNFHFTLETNGLHLTVNVSGLPKERFVVWVVRDRVLVTSQKKVAPDQKVREVITLPKGLYYDPNEVTGTIMEDGQLKITFPVSNEKGGEPEEEKYFEVNVV